MSRWEISDHMSFFTNALTFLGEHFYMVPFACAELVLALVLVGAWLRVRRSRGSAGLVLSEQERTLRRALDLRADECCILMHRSELLPVCAVGDVEKLLGVTLPQLQDDVAVLQSALAVPSDGAKFWSAYRAWDGTSALSCLLRGRDGRWIEVTAQTSDEPDYDLFYFRLCTREQAERKEYEERLDKAEAASQFKTSFLFRMSHEIRTPMNGICGMLTLAEGRLTPDHPAMQYLTKANELSDHLLSLINDILDMSRIEAGKVELESSPFSLRQFGAKLYDMFAKTLEEKGIRYAVNFEEMTADWVVGDELRLGQVVINFLSNAVKFTSEGEVVVTFRQMLLRGGALDLMIRVHDTGIGMKPEFIERIFRPFEQEDASTTRRFGGTGLGMAISDQLVKLMGGQIVVESLPGKGSDFTVYLSLPLAEAPAEETRPETPASESAPARTLDGCRILMAEDNEINAMIAVEVLGEQGVSVDVAENGQIAVDRFSASAPGEYDVILMDIQMPVMDGRTAARTIRALPRPDAKTIPIFALSADAFVEDERQSREAGMNGHLTKPIDFEALTQTILNALTEKEDPAHE